jgi:hypothetical protein
MTSRATLALLRSLTEDVPRWGVLKNIDAALDGRGDIDSFLEESEWALALASLRRWVAREELGPTVVCRHIPGACSAVTVDTNENRLMQLDLFSQMSFRGGLLFTARALERMTVMDPRGFRRLSHGAEGLLVLCLNSLQHGGTLDRCALKAKGTLELLHADPDGVRQGASLFGLASTFATSLASNAPLALDTPGSFGWSRRVPGVVLQIAVAGRALKDPSFAAKRVRFRLRGNCPVGAALANDRQLPSDLPAWLRIVERDHEILG